MVHTIGEYDDDDTAVTETTQDELNKFTHIQPNLENQMSNLLGKLG